MHLKNTKQDFGGVAILVHWIIAILMIGLIALGLYMVDLPVSLEKLKFFGWHKEYGILVLMLAIVRISWRLYNITPSLDSLPWWERLAARSMHWIFYGFMFAMPLTGWMLSSASGLSVSFFGLFLLPNLVPPSDTLRVLLTNIHQWLGYALIAAIAGHTAAALKHQFINKDGILRRMIWPQ